MKLNRYRTLLISVKQNPTPPNRNAILNHKRNAIEKIAEKLYNLIGDKSNELFEENDIETTKMDASKNSKEDSNGLGFNGRYDVKELGNSSFSLTKNQIMKIYRNIKKITN